jgi:hypothetical protein
MKSLVQLLIESQEIERQLLESGGEITPAVETLLEVNTGDIINKVDNYNFLVEKLASNEAYWKAKAAEYTAFAKSFAKAQERIKDHLKTLMLTHDLKEVVGNEVRYTLRPSAGSLVIDNESIIPDRYLVVKTEVNKAEVKLAIASGKEVVGAHIEPGFVLSKYNKKI